MKESEPKWGQTIFDSERENADLTSIGRRIMRLIIEAYLVDDEGSTERPFRHCKNGAQKNPIYSLNVFTNRRDLTVKKA